VAVCSFDNGANALRAEVLMQMVLGNPSTPQTFLCCTALHNADSKIYLLHALSRFTPVLDGATTPWDSQVFCCLGEILQDTVMIVAIRATAFKFTANTWVYNKEALAEQLLVVPHPQLLPRLAAGAANAVSLCTRYLMYLPSKYASLLLSNKGYSVREVYQILVTAFQADNFLADAMPILTLCTESMANLAGLESHYIQREAEHLPAHRC